MHLRFIHGDGWQWIALAVALLVGAALMLSA